MGIDWKHTYYHAWCFLDCFSLQMVQSPKGLIVAKLPSLDNASPNGLALHNGNMLCLHLELGLLDCSGWLLGQEYEVPADSASGTDFLLSDCSCDSAADAEGTASKTTAEAGADSA
jgi:hypothetical protein